MTAAETADGWTTGWSGGDGTGCPQLIESMEHESGGSLFPGTETARVSPGTGANMFPWAGTGTMSPGPGTETVGGWALGNVSRCICPGARLRSSGCSAMSLEAGVPSKLGPQHIVTLPHILTTLALHPDSCTTTLFPGPSRPPFHSPAQGTRFQFPPQGTCLLPPSQGARVLFPCQGTAHHQIHAPWIKSAGDSPSHRRPTTLWSSHRQHQQLPRPRPVAIH